VTKPDVVTRCAGVAAWGLEAGSATIAIRIQYKGTERIILRAATAPVERSPLLSWSGWRHFSTLLGGAAVAWPLAARAQQAGKLPIIGFLGATTPTIHGQWAAAFVQRLRELGWIEARNIAIEYRWAEGRNERYAEIESEFVRLKVDVIVTWGTAPVVAAKRATAVIPIVFTTAGDPVATGLVASLARPGGNVTGLSNQIPDLAGKRLELLREIIPGDLRRLAILSNAISRVLSARWRWEKFRLRRVR
jgi:putative ABC transport system substrate-binding protein